MLTSDLVCAATGRLPAFAAAIFVLSDSAVLQRSSMLGLLAALALLLAMGALGVALLRRLARLLDPLEQLVYGVPLGVVIASLVLLALAILFGLSPLLVAAIGVGSVLAAALIWPDWRSLRGLGMHRFGEQPSSGIVAVQPRTIWPALGLLPLLVLGGFALRWALFWAGGLNYTADGLWAGHVNIWGDWPQHLGDVTSFAYSANFPPMHPRLVGHPHDYHYLAALTSAAWVTLSVDPATSLTLHSFLFSLLVLGGLYAFARRLTGDRGVAALMLILFLLGGGLGWLLTIADLRASDTPWATFWQQPWNASRQGQANFRWENMYFAFIMPQRGYLYGMPLGLLCLTLLLIGVEQSAARWFGLAGIVAALLPLAHLSTLLSLALITPFLFLLFPSRWWLLFFGVWVLLAVPQLYIQQGGERGATAALRLQIGWIAKPDAWLWFWLKNLGAFLPLLLVALTQPDLLPKRVWLFLWGFMPAFAIANLVVFQPWDWDNHKVLVYWFLAVSILVAALLMQTWRRQRSPVVRGLLVVVVLTMTLSGLLINLHQLLGRSRYQLANTEEIALAELVLTQTPADAVFAVGIQNNHPVPMLTGRRVVMSYPGWLWTHGIDVTERERDLREIYAFGERATALIEQYGVDYVVIGPGERNELAANVAAFQSRYPVMISTPNYQVFDVR
ncbi:MAG: hypothetical protein JOZ51_22730 [Chloroflexi bacterium]|nr:hypothetical protein [Chloroflexota bacterium]